ncbi:MAG: hypothetical protein QOE46_204 [Acidobacteriota bacterium]|jgi:hypothetical protein|nr:hypothetical protein [Acidobacteriota bacterium]
MTKGTGKNKSKENSIPPMGIKPWTLCFRKDSIPPPPPHLESGDIVTITLQEQNLDTAAIIGVVTDKAGKQYPLNGQVDAESVVTFFVTSGDSVYFFKGTVQLDAGSMSMGGSFKLVPPDDGHEDGNWSAQAQGGGDDDAARPNPKPRHRRSR